MKVLINKKEFDAKIAKTPEKRAKGLSGLNKLPEGKALILYYSEPETVAITMNGMKFSIAAIFVKDNKIQAVGKLNPDDEDLSIGKDSDYVIEINKSESKGIRRGQTVEIIGSKDKDSKINYLKKGDVNEGEMHVLDENGDVQMTVKGNERIFSRLHTKKLVELSQKAKDSKDFIKLGKELYKILEIHRTQTPQYVEE